MIDPRDNQDKGQKQAKPNPGREDDRGMDKGARGTDDQKAPARKGQAVPAKSDQKK